MLLYRHLLGKFVFWLCDEAAPTGKGIAPLEKFTFNSRFFKVGRFEFYAVMMAGVVILKLIGLSIGIFAKTSNPR